MQTITELIVRIADLVEAEGRQLRSMAVRVALAVALIIVGAGAVAAGVGFMMAAVYFAAAERIGTPGAAAVTGVLALALGGGLAWLGRRMGT